MNLRSVLPGGHGRRLRVRRGAAMVVAVGLAMLGGIAVTATSASAEGHARKVWVCHATSSDSNPYRIIHVDESAVKRQGHEDHRDDPNKTWKYGGTFGGVTHVANQAKPDIIGDLGDDAPPTACGGATGNASLMLVKVKIGGPALATAWTLDAVGTTQGASSFAQGTTPVTDEVADGTYTLSEAYVPTDGGDANYTPSLWDCTNTGVNRAFVIIGADDTDVTCTITNTFNFTPPPDAPAISLVKLAALGDTNGDGLANPGESITYTFKVTNTGNVALSDVTVIDAIVAVGTVTCPETTLAVGATFTCTAAVFPVTDLNATGADIVNEATASGRPPTGSRVEATDTVSTPTGGVVEEVVTVQPAEVPTQVVKGEVVTNAPVVAPAQVESLAFTGAETVPLGLSGLLALLLGAGLVASTRRQGRRANN